MKDLYKQFNNIEIDVDEFEEMEVSEFERAKVKKELKNKINTSKQRKGKKLLAAASLAVGLSVSAIVGLSFTAYADNIPVISNIYKFFYETSGDKGDFYAGYADVSTPINLTATSNGINVTVNDAIYDGESMIVTYTIDANRDLGYPVVIRGIPHLQNSPKTGSHEASKVSESENKYVGIFTMKMDEEDTSLPIEWNIDYLRPGRTIDNDPIEGDWKFNFTLNKADISIYNIDKKLEQDDLTIHLQKLTISPNSFHFLYEQIPSDKLQEEWDRIAVDLIVRDDLGNLYSLEEQSGSGGSSLKNNENNIKWGAIYEKINPEATQLIITPDVELYDYDIIRYSEGGSIIGRGRSYNSTADQKQYKMDDIIIDLK
ncbi:DUF4179 domain-containing protein [Psychrobacillus sp. NPDC093200]|uniref:DUF4179 domain-containing protein n=1 Tax=Psychrobacillus sp. NPDC093200 TaxID=3390656 RepID=UPI003D011456